MSTDKNKQGEIMENTDFLENSGSNPTESDLKRISNMCISLSTLRKDINFMKERLRLLEKSERMLSQEEIPTMLFSKGLQSIKLEDGQEIKIKEDIKVTLPKNPINRLAVLRWITENDGSDIIKREVKIEDPELLVTNFLKDNKIPFLDLKSIHASTLKAWFRGKLGIAKGSLQEIEIADVPKEANLFMYKQTIIKE